ncbi:hypothetical protein IW262DRAFT_1317584 [Armillaria fumosa]|nr:hypothetical protein IW262DRAFT_1317584 [Armillaria fumosa]
MNHYRQQHLLRHLFTCRRLLHQNGRYLSTKRNETLRDTPSSSSNPPKSQPSPGDINLEHQKSWLTRKVESSPTTRWWFMKFVNLLGYGTPKQLAGRRTFPLYARLCAAAPDAEMTFWHQDCDLPPTFQSWFTVTNLHTWMLAVRFRALPSPHGKEYVQGLVDHFFLDIEDRIRAVLQPPSKPTEPYTFASSFYTNPNAPTTGPDGKPIRRRAAPERLVSRQMKIFKEQWAGMWMSLDHAMVKGDMELAAAVWRNLLGARGAAGIAYPDPNDPSAPAPYRRTVNLVGGLVENIEKIDFEKEAHRDDGSGVYDYAPSEADKYVKYPDLMLDVVTYLRRELVRLENIGDEEIMHGDIAGLGFGRIAESTVDASKSRDAAKSSGTPPTGGASRLSDTAKSSDVLKTTPSKPSKLSTSEAAKLAATSKTSPLGKPKNGSSPKPSTPKADPASKTSDVKSSPTRSKATKPVTPLNK